MKKIKLLLIFLITVTVLPMFVVSSCAAEYTAEYYDEQLAASEADKLKSELSRETNDYLERLGYDGIEFESIVSSEPEKLINLLLEILCGKASGPIKAAMKLAAIIILAAIAQSFCPDDDKTKTVFGFVLGGLLLTAVFAPAYSVIGAGFSAVGVCAGFEKALIPVLAAVLTASGNPAAALSYQGMTFAAAQGVTVIVNRFGLPMAAMTGTLGVAGALTPTLKISSVGDLIKKAMLTVISVSAALFTGILTIKNTLAASADTLAAKGIKLAANTFVPVLGGALSEAYSSVAGSLALVKNSIGAFAIAAVFLTVVPVVIELVLWIFALKAADTCAALFGLESAQEILKAVSSVFVMAAVLIIFSAAVFIISSGTVLSMRSA